MQSSETFRVRSWVKRSAMVALPVLILLCGVAVWDYIETRRLTREIAAIQARGEPITTGPMHARAYNKADNAEYRYSAAGILSLANEIGDPTVEGRTAMSTYARFTPVRMWLSGSQPRPALADTGDVTKTLLTEWRDIFSLVDRAAEQPYYGIAAGGEYNYRVAGLWNLMRLLSARTIGFSLAGDADAAVRSAISSIRVRRALRPSQRSLSVHEVPAVLSLSKPSEAALERLQTALAEEENPDGGTQDFIDARAGLLNDAWLRLYRVAPGTQLPAPFPGELLPSRQMRPLVTHELVRALRAWSEFSEIARKPWPERYRLGTEAVTRYADEKSLPGRVNGVAIAAGMFYQTIRPDVLVHDRASRIAVAVERYRRAHAEALPADLKALVPQYLASIPEDPLTGQPLRYRAMPDAYVVYSVGPDGTDDGGTTLRPTSPSARDTFPADADMGIRVVIDER